MKIDFTPVEVKESYSLLPPGDYEVVCEQCELQDNKNQTGNFLYCRFTITSGNYKGRFLSERYTYQHPSADAVRIGHEQLSRLCKAIGIERIDDTQQLVGKRFVVTVAVRKRSDTGDEINYCKRYLTATNAAAMPVQPQNGVRMSGKPW